MHGNGGREVQNWKVRRKEYRGERIALEQKVKRSSNVRERERRGRMKSSRGRKMSS